MRKPVLSEQRTMLPDIFKQDDVTLVVFGQQYGDLDPTLIDQLRSRVFDAIQKADPALVVLDLSQTNYIGSNFLGVLLQGWKILKQREEARMAVCGLSPFVEQLFAVSRFDRIWQIHPTRDDAVAAMSRKDN